MYSVADLLSFGIYMSIVGTIITGFAITLHFKGKK